ncbi:Hypothetical protein CINCED_3A017018 [Cinara cedri]|uniref:Uncharacterized protein n=1 Tax=Cinara cedri TaxID=506608 RepID=A0A5E4M974_9HEMI|nr:Hypothetical protein CINCED_3A017018 [Cinara cedri]
MKSNTSKDINSLNNTIFIDKLNGLSKYNLNNNLSSFSINIRSIRLHFNELVLLLNANAISLDRQSSFKGQGGLPTTAGNRPSGRKITNINPLVVELKCKGTPPAKPKMSSEPTNFQANVSVISDGTGDVREGGGSSSPVLFDATHRAMRSGGLTQSTTQTQKEQGIGNY